MKTTKLLKSAANSSESTVTVDSKTKPRIFVVEDDVMLSMDIGATLLGFNYEIVGTSSSGEDALKLIESAKPDLILMDIGLSGKLDGVQTAEQLALRIATPVLFLTGITEESTLQRAKLTQPCGYLIKPFDPTELRVAIELGLYRGSLAAQQLEQPHGTNGIEADEIIEREFAATDEAFKGDGNKDTKIQLLAKVALFSALPRTELDKLSDLCRIREFSGGEFIFHEGSPALGGFVLLSGKIAVTKSAVSGKTLILQLLSAGDVYGLFFLLKEFAGSCAARAQVDCRVLWLPDQAFAELKKRTPEIVSGMLSQVGTAMVRSFELSSSLAHSRVEARIINALLSLLPAGNPKVSPAAGRLFMTRKELADLTGTTPETAIRVTKNLERAHLLDLTRPGIIKIPNREALKEALDE